MIKNSKELILIIFVFIAFGLGWFVAYGNETFFNEKGVMNQSPPVSSIDPIGIDLRQVLTYSHALVHRKSPYIDANIYPPLTSILGVPLLLLSIQNAYILISFLTILALFAGIFIVNTSIGGRSQSLLFLVFYSITSFFSYGLHFELERGQFNVIALFFAVLGIWLFKLNKRVFALIAISLAIQFKLNPLIFLIFFFNFNFKDIKNILFVIGAILFNFGLFFILGGKIFLEFIYKLSSQFSHPFLWVGNHSLIAYCSGVTSATFCTLQMYPYLLGSYFVVLILVCFLIWRMKLSHYNSFLFAICGCGTLLIPSVSHDYTLSLLPIFLLPLSKDLYTLFVTYNSKVSLILLSLVIFLYAQALFAFQYRWIVFPLSVNKAPVLMLLIVVSFIGIVVMLQSRKARQLFV